jgi:hypothetical protein
MNETPNLPSRLSDQESLIFIIRIWQESRDLTSTNTLWRGVIEHVPTQTRRYLQDLEAIRSFIASYLGELGTPSI